MRLFKMLKVARDASIESEAARNIALNGDAEAFKRAINSSPCAVDDREQDSSLPRSWHSLQ
jgi:hypothetical protein